MGRLKRTGFNVASWFLIYFKVVTSSNQNATRRWSDIERWFRSEIGEKISLVPEEPLVKAINACL